jgi:hypothetical protein
VAEHSASPRAWIETSSPYLLRATEEPAVDKHLIKLFREMDYFYEPSCYGLELPRVLSILEGSAAA